MISLELYILINTFNSRITWFSFIIFYGIPIRVTKGIFSGIHEEIQIESSGEWCGCWSLKATIYMSCHMSAFLLPKMSEITKR